MQLFMTSFMYRGHTFTITHEPNRFSVDFPTFPSIVTSGETEWDAFRNACEALDLYLEASSKARREK